MRKKRKVHKIKSEEYGVTRLPFEIYIPHKMLKNPNKVLTFHLSAMNQTPAVLEQEIKRLKKTKGIK
jgi:hypothetical protein